MVKKRKDKKVRSEKKRMVKRKKKKKRVRSENGEMKISPFASCTTYFISTLFLRQKYYKIKIIFGFVGLLAL